MGVFFDDLWDVGCGLEVEGSCVEILDMRDSRCADGKWLWNSAG